MLKWLSFIGELMRLCLLLVLSLYVLGLTESMVYKALFGSPVYHWTMGLGNFILFFVLYRNVFQFKGWYKSEKNRKLNGRLTRSLAVLSSILILIPLGMNL